MIHANNQNDRSRNEIIAHGTPRPRRTNIGRYQCKAALSPGARVEDRTVIAEVGNQPINTTPG